jgi:hypothetical protein
MKTIICQHCKQPYSGIQNMTRRKYCGMACAKAAERSKGPERFWAKVDKESNPNGCWIYTGFKKWDGYGWVARAQGDGRVRWMTAHRYAWILTNGEPEEGLHILHQCDNPPCCNPAHLRLGTHQDNMADQVSKLRHVFGERSGRNKIKNYEEAEEIRRRNAAGESYTQLAAEYGVARSHIYQICTHRCWNIPSAAPVLHPGRVRPVRRQA